MALPSLGVGTHPRRFFRMTSPATTAFVVLFKPLNPTAVVMPPRLHTLCHLFSSFPSPTLLRPSLFPSRCVVCGYRNSRRSSSIGSDRSAGDAQGMEVEYNRKRAERGEGGRRKNLQLKVRKLNPVNTICYLQILGTGMDTQDTSPSVLLFFDRQRIIFNAGEGLQRFCTEHKIKLSKINHMFLTRVCSETASGLPGLLLTLAGIGDDGMSVNVWGPSDLRYLVGAMKSFVPHAAMVHTHSFGEVMSERNLVPAHSSQPHACGSRVLIDDDVVRISAILLRPKLSRGSENIGFSHVKLKSDPKPGDVAVIYVCELPEIKGKFDPSKAASLGLKPGPKYKELQFGKSVKSDQLDIMVHPSDVLGPSTPGPVILLVDCPTEFHLSELHSLQSLNHYYTSSTNQQSEDAKTVNCIIHLGPASVTNNTDYKSWMKKFGTAKHILAGHETKNIEVPVLRSSARITSRLSYLCPQLFPFQLHDGSCQKSISAYEESSEVISAENLLKFHLRPYALLGVDKSTIPSFLSTDEIVKELITEIPEIVDTSNNVSMLWKCFEKARSKQTSISETVDVIEERWMNKKMEIADQQLALSEDINILCNLDIPSCLENINRDEMEIVFLGTGSSQPSKYRNVSSIYINLFSRGGILLDCGEGTLGQLKRRFGVKGADDAVKALRLIWISHIHADHHVGLARILALRWDLLGDMPHEPLLVIGPRPLERFLDAYSQLENLDMQFLDCQHTTEVSWDAFSASLSSGEDCSSKEFSKRTVSRSLENTIFAKCNQTQSYWKHPGSPVHSSVVRPLLAKLKEVLQDAGLDSLYSIPVVHCPQAFGIVLKSSKSKNRIGKDIPGWKLVYSADTRPCQALVDASKDATILIHEATFEDGMEDEAIARNHSTTMEAIQVGTQADVYRIILTHFSQRYPKIPVFDEAHMDKTCIAFDMMSVNLVDLPILPRVLPYLKLLFKNEVAMDADDVATIATNY